MSEHAPAASVPSVAVGHTTLSVIFYQDQPVITLAMMDQAHERPEGTAGRNFRQNQAKLIEGEDYFRVCADEIRRHKLFEISPKSHEDFILLTETGYLMLVKSFTDDLAWQVQRQLVTGYFRARAASPLEPRLTLEQRVALEARVRRVVAWSGMSGPQPEQWVYVRLKTWLGLPRMADLTPAQLPHAYAELARLEAELTKFLEFQTEVRKFCCQEIIGAGLPWTGDLAKRWRKQMRQALPPRPNWVAIAALLGVGAAPVEQETATTAEEADDAQ